MSEPEKTDPHAAARAILAHYDKNKDATLSREEIANIVEDYTRHKEAIPPEVLAALKKYDANADGSLDEKEIQKLHEDIHASRYIAYAGMAARAARYLAYTSDLGEAFRPVVRPLWVTASYGISWAYCIGDVAFESKKAHERGVRGMELARFSTERAVFQAVASMAIPAFTIHSTVNVFKKITAKAGRFQRFGPTAAGLAVIPFLPIVDVPAERAVEWVFGKVWPSQHHA